MGNKTIPEEKTKVRPALPRKPRRTKRKGRHPSNDLTAAFCRHVAESGRYCDGNGLYLQVDPSGARRWIQKLVIQGTSRVIGLGSFTFVTLAEARDLAYTNRKTARAGGDPLAERRRARATPTFRQAADKVLKQKRGAWRNEKHARDWPTSLRLYVFPRIGDKLVSDVTSADLLEILAPLWHAKPETARRVRHRIGTVLKWAVAMEHRTDNPAGEALAHALGKQQRVVRHRPALPYSEVARALDIIRASDAWVTTKLGFEFLVLTATRSAEVRLATWGEIDRRAAVWTIPATRMKGLREHRVPLGRRALEIVEQADALREISGTTDPPDLVFPSRRLKPLADVTFSKLVREHEISAVPHGFRSSFRDWGAELTDHPREVIEIALAHVVGNATELAYARSDLFERRRQLMQDWDDYLHRPRGKIVPMRR